MKRYISFMLLAVLFIGAPGVFANAEESEFSPPVTLAVAASPDAATEIPQDLLNNQYYLESLRLTLLAQENFEYGDYDASADYAAEALRYALLSDEYVSLQLKIREVNNAITTARTRIDWAVSIRAAERYPEEFAKAQETYNEAVAERSEEHWDPAIDAANRSINTLAFIQGAPPVVASRGGVLPSRYVVRSWSGTKDCFWNIAGQSWAYGDPFKWRILYNANKAKLPHPNNPNLIEPGTILDIPSIQGEKREGAWEPAK